MNYIGLDLSLTNSGYMVASEVKLESHGVIKTRKRGIERLQYIYEEISDLIKCYSNCIIAIEGYAFSPNQGRSFSLGELGGIIKLLLYQNKIKYYVVAPTTLKKFATGSGRAQKSDIAKEVYKRWGAEFKTEHEVDAFVLAKIAYYLSTGNTGKLKKRQLEALKVVSDDKGGNNNVV